MARTALQTAMQGGKVSDRQAQNALKDAVSRITRSQKSASRSREHIATTGVAVVHGLETHGTAFLASLAEGYLGGERLKVGSVDLRAIGGLGGQAVGIVRTLQGKADGGHLLALSNGLFASFLVSSGIQAGQKLAQKRGAVPSAAPNVYALPQPVPFPGPVVQGLREVTLTPEPEVAASTTPSTDGRFVRAARM